MRRSFSLIVTTMLLCCPAAAVQAQARFPEVGALQLPVLSTGTAAAMRVLDVALSVTFTDGGGTQLASSATERLKWREGAWRTSDGRTLAQVQLPARFLESISGVKPHYQLDYTVSYSVGASPSSVNLTERLALSDDLRATAEFPLQPVTVDGSDLDWEALSKVSWHVESRFGSMRLVSDHEFLANSRVRRDGVPVSRMGTVIARIRFLCASGKVVPWPDDGKNLRSLPTGLTITLTQPTCSP